jgi:hypothetical protein
MGPSTDIDDVEKRKILPQPEIEFRPLDRLAHSQSNCVILTSINVIVVLKAMVEGHEYWPSVCSMFTQSIAGWQITMELMKRNMDVIGLQNVMLSAGSTEYLLFACVS